MHILVIGGTGRAGAQVVVRLVEAGIATRVLSRSVERLHALPAEVAGVVGDLADPATLRAALAGVDRVCLITPKSPTETEQGLAAVAAAQAAGVERIVYLSAVVPPGADRVPHLKSKLVIEGAIRQSGIDYTIVRPQNFFQNDLTYRTALLELGLYPQPIGGVGISRVDLRDVADAAVHALTEAKHVGRTYTLSGPEVLTGEAVAAVFSAVLEHPVCYAGDDLAAWAERVRTTLPAWMVVDLQMMYAFYQQHGSIATAAELAQQQALLHRPPRTFAAFAAETAIGWKGKR